jgi:hypothetical protein
MNPRETVSEKPSPNEHGQPAVLFCCSSYQISTFVQAIAVGQQQIWAAMRDENIAQANPASDKPSQHFSGEKR